jgi:hypothetical protein
VPGLIPQGAIVRRHEWRPPAGTGDHARSAREGTQLYLVLNAVTIHPGKRAPEIATITGLDGRQTRMALMRLKRDGLIVAKGEPRAYRYHVKGKA